jgi:hypothetical protein
MQFRAGTRPIAITDLTCIGDLRHSEDLYRNPLFRSASTFFREVIIEK